MNLQRIRNAIDKDQLKVLFVILLICIAVIIVKYRGMDPGIQEQQSLIIHEKDPSLLKNDWFVNLSSDFNIRSAFIKLVVVSDTLINNYEITYILLLLCFLFIFSTGFYKTVLLLTKNPKLAFFSISFPLLLPSKFGLGNSFEIGAFFLPGTIALAIAIWAVYLFLIERYSISFLLLSLASLFHPIIALILYGAFIFSIIFRKDTLKGKRISLLKSAYFFIGFSIIGIPLLSQLNTNINPSNIIYILARFRAPWHYSPFTWSLVVWASFIGFFILFLIAFKYSKIDKKYKSVFMLFVIAIFLCYILGTIFVEIIPIKLFVKLQLFRASELLNIIEFIFISEFIYNAALKVNSQKRYLILFISTLLVLDLFWGISFLAPSLFNRLLLKMPLAILLGVGITIIMAKTKRIRIILAVLVAIFLITYMFYNPLIPRYRESKEVTDMFLFIQENTPKNSVFLASPSMTLLRVGAERATIINFQAFIFGDNAMVEWYNRILDVTNSQDKAYQKGVSFEDIKDGYKTLSKEDILRLKEKYGFDYAVFEKPKELNYSIFYENSRFVVYKV